MSVLAASGTLAQKGDELCRAAVKGDLTAISALLHVGADVNHRGDAKFTPLIWAAEKGHLKTVELLIDKGADIDAKTSSGTTALMLASAFGHKSVIDTLLNHRADINAHDRDGWTPLDYAAWNNRADIALHLLEKGADAASQHAIALAKNGGHMKTADIISAWVSVHPQKAKAAVTPAEKPVAIKWPRGFQL